MGQATDCFSLLDAPGSSLDASEPSSSSSTLSPPQRHTISAHAGSSSSSRSYDTSNQPSKDNAGQSSSSSNKIDSRTTTQPAVPLAGPDVANSLGESRQPALSPAAAAGAAAAAREPRDSCLICFDSLPLSTMVAATLSQCLASSSSQRGTCGHFVCKECMRQYVVGKIQVSSSSTCESV
jgi:hypothetical protein